MVICLAWAVILSRCRPLIESLSIAKYFATATRIEDSEIENTDLRVTVEDGAKRIPPLFAMLSENNIEVVSVSASKPTLDDVFLQVTGYRLEGTEETEENKEEVS